MRKCCKCKALKFWEDQIYINKDFNYYTVGKRRILFKRSKEIRERGGLVKLFITGLFPTKFNMLLLFKMKWKFAISPNQINFENSHFNPFYNKIFSDAEHKRDPDENTFNEVDTQNFECYFQ